VHSRTLHFLEFRTTGKGNRPSTKIQHSVVMKHFVPELY